MIVYDISFKVNVLPLMLLAPLIDLKCIQNVQLFWHVLEGMEMYVFRVCSPKFCFVTEQSSIINYVREPEQKDASLKLLPRSRMSRSYTSSPPKHLHGM
jgi:hypothetical protein